MRVRILGIKLQYAILSLLLSGMGQIAIAQPDASKITRLQEALVAVGQYDGKPNGRADEQTLKGLRLMLEDPNASIDDIDKADIPISIARETARLVPLIAVAHESRWAAYNDPLAWAASGGADIGPQIFKKSGFTRFTWPDYAGILNPLMAGAIPIPLELNEHYSFVAFYNTASDMLLVASYRREGEAFRLEDARIYPGELIRGEPEILPQPKWRFDDHYIEGLIDTSYASIMTLTKIASNIRNAIAYLDELYVKWPEKKFVEARLANMTLSASNSFACGKEINTAVQSVDFTGAMGNAAGFSASLKKSGLFIDGGGHEAPGDAIKIMSSYQVPSQILAVVASKKDACKIIEAYTFNVDDVLSARALGGATPN